MTRLAYAAETPFRTVRRIFGAVIIALALLLGISALSHPAAAWQPSITHVAPSVPASIVMASR